MDHSPPAPTPQAKVRKYGFSCLLCRRRKVKCDGKKPTCTNCLRSKEVCNYKEKNAVLVVHLAEKLQKYKARLSELENQIRELANLDGPSRDHRIETLVFDLNQSRQFEEEDSTPSPLSFALDDPHTAEEFFDGTAEFSVDENGTVR